MTTGLPQKWSSVLLSLGLLVIGSQSIGIARADSWTLPYRQRVASSSKGFEVLVEPSSSSSDTGATLSLWERVDGKSLRRYQRRSVNRWSPVHCHVGDDGSVVTFDDWLRAGYDHALVIYNQFGEIVRDSTLDEVLTPEELKRVERSVSSRHWVYAAEPVRVSGSTVRLTTIWGAAFTIDLKTGAIRRTRGHFQNLLRLALGDLQSLTRLEYEQWDTKERFRCSWEAEEVACETVDKEWLATALFRKKHPRSRLQGRLTSIAELLDYVESPTYSTSASDRKELRLFFKEADREYAYSVVLKQASLKSSTVRDSFERLLQATSFEGLGR